MPSNQVTINGIVHSLEETASVRTAIEILKPASVYVAAELNGEILEQEDFDKKLLKNGDILEIIQPLGGGSR